MSFIAVNITIQNYRNAKVARLEVAGLLVLRNFITNSRTQSTASKEPKRARVIYFKDIKF